MNLEPGDIVVLKSDPNGQKFTLGGKKVEIASNIYWFDVTSFDMKSFKINKSCLKKV